MNIKKILSLLIIFLAFSFLILNIYQNWRTVTAHSWKLTMNNVILLLGFLSIVYLVNATSWHFLMKTLRVRLSYLKNLKVWLYSNTARLIPGTIWQYGSRIVLASNEGIDKKKITTALFIELFFNLSLGTLVSILGIIWLNLHVSINLTLVAILFSSLILFAIIISRFAKINLDYRWIPLLFIFYLLQFVIDGSVLFFLSSMVVELSLIFYPVFISIFAISWLLGYLSFFTPAGLGVQEISMATLLSFYMPFPIAGIVAIAFRMTLYLSEGLTLLIVSYISRRRF